MSNLNDQGGVNFKKNPYRPWDLNSLEQATNNPKIMPNPVAMHPEPPNFHNLPNKIANQPNNYYHKKPEQLPATGILQKEIAKENLAKDALLKEINKRDNSLLVGGFLQPTNIAVPSASKDGRNIPKLFNQLDETTDKIKALTADLTIAEAKDQAKQAQQEREQEKQAREAAEKRMKIAIDQIHATNDQLSMAIEKIKIAEDAQRTEAKARLEAERKLNAVLEQNQILNGKLKQELEARKISEDKAQVSLNQTIQTELARQEIENTKQQLEKECKELVEQFKKLEAIKNSEEASKNELQQQFNRFQEIAEHDKQTLEKSVQTFQYEHAQLLAHTNELQNQISGLELLIRQQEQQIQVLDDNLAAAKDQQSKLQQIIDTEQNLRKLAEQKANSALAMAAKTKLEQKELQDKMAACELRAKNAIRHASDTVMKFLDTSSNLNTYKTSEEELNEKYLEELLK